MHNPQVFDDPETFKPERFLDSKGHYLSTRHPGFIPFGLGKRSCVGEKLALAYQFLIITNLLQLTSGYEFVLPGRSGTVSLSPALGSQNCYPNQYKVMLKKVT